MQESNQIILDGQTFYKEQQISQEQKRFSFKVTDDKKNLYSLKFHLFDSQLEERIMRIMNKLQELKPPKNIVHIKKHGRYGEYYYILTEYCEDNLYNQLQGKKLANQEDLRYILVSIAEGLNYLHQKDIIHTNLKPEQIFIKNQHIATSFNQQQYKLGFSYFFNDNAGGGKHNAQKPYYIAPEMIKEQLYNQSVDIWSLGTIIYELVTGKILFDGQTIYDIFDLICSQTDESPYIKEKLQVLNPEYRQLVSRMLKVTPSQRPDIKEIIRTLRNDYTKTPPKMVTRMAYSLSRNVIQQFAPSKSQSPYKANYILKKEVSPFQKINQQSFRSISPINSPNPQDFYIQQLQCGFIKSTANQPV